MKEANLGDTVRVHYTVKLEDGTIVESSEGDQPLECTLGSDTLIPGFEQGIIGMHVGERRSVTVTPEQGYGPSRADLQFTIKRPELPEGFIPFLGQILQFEGPEEQPVNVTVVDITEDELLLDANHPFAGTVLVFNIELVDLS
jgi:FKBP-type peptidyl-prolyl cis-trans isomerase 2